MGKHIRKVVKVYVCLNKKGGGREINYNFALAYENSYRIFHF